LIEKLIKTIEPSARLLSFGSSCNSFGLRNSGKSNVSGAEVLRSLCGREFGLMRMADMDLVVLIDDPNAGLESSHLVQMLGDLLERVSGFCTREILS
jgi:terminal uridylyltransferase